jgi:hypothetical protein
VSSISRGDVLLQAAKAQMTASGIVPGHHLLLHLINPRIRHPNEARGLVFYEIRKLPAGVPQANFGKRGD